MPRVLRSLLTAGAVTALAVCGGVLATDNDDAPDDGPSAAPDDPTELPSLSLDDVDTSTLAVARAEFCESVEPTFVARALGVEDGAEAELSAYANGEQATFDRDLRDVAHEFGCTWDAGGGRARAWVFAPPITPEAAEELVGATAAPQRCDPIEDAAAFGQPTVARRCSTQRGEQVSYRGLFGDAWLTCTLTTRAPEPDLQERADDWCAAVAVAASAG